MAKIAKYCSLLTTILLLTVFLFMTISYSQAESSGNYSFATKLSAKAMALKNEKLTHLHFYYHNLLAGPNVTAVPLNPKRPTLDLNDAAGLFGRLTIADNPMTMGPELNSTAVGSAQGLYAVASRSEVAFVELFNFVFTADNVGEFQGSTISVLGHNPILAAGVREMPVVGGTGVFGFARGKAMFNTHSFDTILGNAAVECNFYVFHY